MGQIMIPEKLGYYWLIEEDKKPTIILITTDVLVKCVWFIDCVGCDDLSDERYEKAKFYGPIVFDEAEWKFRMAQTDVNKAEWPFKNPLFKR